jgi:hypothetical protein
MGLVLVGYGASIVWDNSRALLATAQCFRLHWHRRGAFELSIQVRFVAVQLFQPMRRQALPQRPHPDGRLVLALLQVTGEGVVENVMSPILVQRRIPAPGESLGQRRVQLTGHKSLGN